MLIDPTSARYKELFGHFPYALIEFKGSMPQYETLVRCLVDPSICASGEQPIEKLQDFKELFARQTRDLQLGVQYLLHDLVMRPEEIMPDSTTGLLRNLQSTLPAITTKILVARSLSEAGVQDELVNASFGLALKGLSALGPYGKIAAAIIGFGKFIFDVVRKRDQIQKANAKERELLAWSQMPPLQQPSTQTDDYLVMRIKDRMTGGSWTPIFSPRFKATAEWVGVERNGGFAFAPGSTSPAPDLFGRGTQVFTPDDGFGFIPGLDRLTSVVQVSLRPDDPRIGKWRYDPGYFWPIGPAMVRDVGDFYVNTCRLASVAWSWVADQDASPNLYKVHVGEPGGAGDDHLHYLWSRYCQGAMDYLLTKVADWKTVTGSNLEYLYGSGLGCILGTWQCRLGPDSTTYAPRYQRIPEPGLPGAEMNASTSLAANGCVMSPATLRAAAEGKGCLMSLYDTHIRPMLLEVRRRQVHFLRHSLVCAYVRESWDAFKDPALRDLLRAMRQKLLQHPDRFLVELDDVPDSELHLGKDWRQQLVAAGVKKKWGPVGKLAVGTLEPTDEPAPVVPRDPRPMPWGDYTAPTRPRSRAPAILAGVTGAAALGALLLAKRTRTRRGEETDGT